MCHIKVTLYRQTVILPPPPPLLAQCLYSWCLDQLRYNGTDAKSMYFSLLRRLHFHKTVINAKTIFLARKKKLKKFDTRQLSFVAKIELFLLMVGFYDLFLLLSCVFITSWFIGFFLIFFWLSSIFLLYFPIPYARPGVSWKTGPGVNSLPVIQESSPNLDWTSQGREPAVLRELPRGDPECPHRSFRCPREDPPLLQGTGPSPPVESRVAVDLRDCSVG